MALAILYVRSTLIPGDSPSRRLFYGHIVSYTAQATGRYKRWSDLSELFRGCVSLPPFPW